IVASGATSPARAFGAPHTICSGASPPASTWHTCRRSASGCFSADTMRATTTPSSASPSIVTSSTSSPIAVSTSTRRSCEAAVGMCWRSQLSENFMLKFRDWGLGIGDWGLGIGKTGYPSAENTGREDRERRFCPSKSPIPNPQSLPSGKLPEEPQVVVEKRAQVVDAIAQHRQALDAHAEGEAGVALGIDADRAQHVRVDHAAAEHFQPAGAAVGTLPGDV